MSNERLNLPSASGAEIWMNCPAQPSFVKSLPKTVEEPDETTLSGQRIHDALRTESKEGLSENEYNTFELAIKNQTSLLEQWKQDKRLSTVKEGEREERCYLRNQNGAIIASGQIDRHWIAPPYLLIEDLKSQYCWRLTPSHLNKQLRIYAVLAWMEYDGMNGQPINEIRVALNKPKVHASSLDCTDYSRKDLEMSKQQILFELWETEQPDAQFRPGPWCDWCAGKAYCKSAGAYSLIPVSMANAVEMIDQLSHEDLRKIYDCSSTVVKIIDACKARLKALPEATLAELGLVFGKPKVLRPITNVQSAFEFLLSVGVPADKLWSVTKMGNGELATVVQQSLGLPSKDAATKWIREKLAGCITPQETDRPLEKSMTPRLK